MPERNFARDALLHLETMLDRHPTAWRSENGLRALVEWSKLECQRGNANKAVEVARDAAERAKTAGNPYLERLANRQLNDYVSGSCGGSVGGLDPEVLRRVADDLFAQQKYAEAVRAYRTVINSIDYYQSDFGTQKVYLHRYQNNSRISFAEANKIRVAVLRPVLAVELAKLGSSTKGMIEWEGTLEVLAPNAIGYIDTLCTGVAGC